MSDFAQGAAVGLEANKQNPFNAILSSFQSAQARRYKEDAERKKEEAELSKALMVLQYKDNYDRALEKEKAKAEKEKFALEAGEKRKNILLEGQAGGKIAPTTETGAGTFEGTPFGAVGERFKAIDSKQGVRGQGKTLISPMVDKISKSEDAYYTLGNVTSQLEANKDKFAQFLGPGKGALRHPLRSYVNKDLQDFLAWKANVQDAFQQYRVVITGAQASDKEIALLAKNRPTEDDNYEVFTKKTKEVRRIGNQVLTRYINNLGKSGYDVSGFQDTLDNLNQELGGLGGEEQPKPKGKTITLPSGKTITIGQ